MKKCSSFSQNRKLVVSNEKCASYYDDNQFSILANFLSKYFNKNVRSFSYIFVPQWESREFHFL